MDEIVDEGAGEVDRATSGTACIEVHLTVPDAATATHLARTLVEERLAACVQIVPGVTSVYRWAGAVEAAEEHLLLVKSTAEHFEAIRGRVAAEHPYDTPEVLAVPAVAVDARYAAWLRASLHPGPSAGSAGTDEVSP